MKTELKRLLKLRITGWWNNCDLHQGFL